MSKITAKRKGIVIIVEERDGKINILFNGRKDDLLHKILDIDVKRAEPMGGTFYPEPGTMLGYYNALQQDGYEIDVEGDIGTIPYEDGAIY